jgi:hypothetical protein
MKSLQCSDVASAKGVMVETLCRSCSSHASMRLCDEAILNHAIMRLCHPKSCDDEMMPS